jgi:hypothetical protein
MSATTPTSGRPRLVPQAGPAAWQAAELRPADWMIPLGPEEAAEIAAALAEPGAAAPAKLGAVLRQAATRLDNGRGFALLRGLPLEEAQAAPLLELIGAPLGRALPQGPAGETVQLLASPASGAARWRFHADAADIVALLILSQPPDVDPAMLVAAAAVHNAMMKRDRAALALLYAPLPHLLRGPSDQPRVMEMPVFSTASGAFIGRYARDAIEAAQRLPETPRLTAAQVEALDLLDTLCAEPGLALKLDVRPGDVLLFNPLQVWKRRPEGAEGAEPDSAQRQALRLLLVTPNSRALPAGMADIGEGPAAGAAGGGMVGG